MRRTAKLMLPELPNRTMRQTIMATVRGRIQYPNTHRLWKKDLKRPKVNKTEKGELYGFNNSVHSFIA